MVVLMTHLTFQAGFNGTFVASAALLVAILSFILANDFFVLWIYHTEHELFAVVGSVLYSLGEVSMIVGICVALTVLATNMLACIFLGLFTLGFVMFEMIRIWKVGIESPVWLRFLSRGISILVLIAGFCIIWKL